LGSMIALHLSTAPPAPANPAAPHAWGAALVRVFWLSTLSLLLVDMLLLARGTSQLSSSLGAAAPSLVQRARSRQRRCRGLLSSGAPHPPLLPEKSPLKLPSTHKTPSPSPPFTPSDPLPSSLGIRAINNNFEQHSIHMSALSPDPGAASGKGEATRAKGRTATQLRCGRGVGRPLDGIGAAAQL
jgi:hypothetical protein